MFFHARSFKLSFFLRPTCIDQFTRHLWSRIVDRNMKKLKLAGWVEWKNGEYVDMEDNSSNPDFGIFSSTNLSFLALGSTIVVLDVITNYIWGIHCLTLDDGFDLNSVRKLSSKEKKFWWSQDLNLGLQGVKSRMLSLCYAAALSSTSPTQVSNLLIEPVNPKQLFRTFVWSSRKMRFNFKRRRERKSSAGILCQEVRSSNKLERDFGGRRKKANGRKKPFYRKLFK